MKDINLKEKEEVMAVRRSAPSLSIALIVIGAILLVIGVITFKTSDMDKYYSDKDINESIDAANIKNISVESGLIDIDIKKSNTDKIEVRCKNVPETFYVKAEGDTLKISQDSSDFNFFLSFDSWIGASKHRTAEIYLPDKEYESVVCNTGIGDLDLYDITCGRFELDTGTGNTKVINMVCKTATLDTGTGNLNVEGFKCEGSCVVDTGVGNTKIKDSEIGGLDCDLGVGNMDYHGAVNGDISLDCGVGNANLYLTNPASDFNGGKYRLDIDSGVGNVKVTYDN